MLNILNKKTSTVLEIEILSLELRIDFKCSIKIGVLSDIEKIDTVPVDFDPKVHKEVCRINQKILLTTIYDPKAINNMITFRPYMILDDKKKCAGEAYSDLSTL